MVTPSKRRRTLTLDAHHYLKGHIAPGDLVIDATIGNGQDTRFLAERVGPQGRVIGFDVQSVALTRTRERLESSGQGRNVTLYAQGHETLLQRLAPSDIGKVSAVVFNLGYLPHGDKALTTLPKTTCTAVTAAWRALRPGGVISLLAYVGHPGGLFELAAVNLVLDMLASKGAAVIRQTDNTTSAPLLVIVQKPAC